MNKGVKRIVGISIGLLLWGFFFIQEEFAFLWNLFFNKL